MITYIKKSIKGYYIEFPEAMDTDYWKDEIGSTFSDFQDNKWVPLTDEQVEFHKNNPSASVREVWDMETYQSESTEKTLDQIKQEKIWELERYDSSDSVNSFLVNNKPTWISATDRSNYRTSIEAAEIVGKTEVSVYIVDQLITLTTERAKTILAQIQLYADSCYLTTMQHKKAIQALETAEEVNNYDYTVNYPEKLNFNV